MFAIILAVVALVIVINQNSKITHLEKLIESRIAPKIPVKPNSNEFPGVAPHPDMAAQATQVAQATPIPMPIAPTQSSSPSPTTSHDISSEEASGRFLGKLGIAAVLIGVAFFLKYAFDNNWIGPSERVMIGLLIGAALIALGQWLRNKYLNYSDLLIGGGLAVLYLSIFAAHSFYGLIDPATTGVCMFIVTLIAFAISIYDATINLAAIAIIGGFATPFLIGSHENNMVELFAYMTILNVGVLAISFFKKWSKLVLISFIGTGITFMWWFSVFYNQSEMAPTLFFIAVTFLIFIVASVTRSLIAGIQAEPVDYLLLGANAFAFAFLNYIILNPSYHSYLAPGAIITGLVYIYLAYLSNKTNPQDKALNIFLPGLAVTFISIAVPLHFDGTQWIATAWLVEACILYFIASLINNRGFQVMGVIVYILGLLNVFTYNLFDHNAVNATPLFNAGFGLYLLAIVVSYVISYMYRRFGSVTIEIQKRGMSVFVIIANVLTIFSLSSQILLYYGPDQVSESNTAVSIFLALYAALLTGIGFARRFPSIRRLGLVLFVITGLKVFTDVWSLGQIYRIVSFIVFGIIALAASFAYAKYRDRLKEIV